MATTGCMPLFYPLPREGPTAKHNSFPVAGGWSRPLQLCGLRELAQALGYVMTPLGGFNDLPFLLGDAVQLVNQLVDFGVGRGDFALDALQFRRGKSASHACALSPSCPVPSTSGVASENLMYPS